MDPILNRFGRLIRSYLQEDESDVEHRGDPDMQDAWDELNDFLSDDSDIHSADFRSGNTGTAAGQDKRTHTGTASRTAPPEALRQDYANLEVPFGSSYQKVREEYRRLMREYHPDKYGKDSEKMRIATEIAQKINNSYQRIRHYESTGKTD